METISAWSEGAQVLDWAGPWAPGDIEPAKCRHEMQDKSKSLGHQ